MLFDIVCFLVLLFDIVEDVPREMVDLLKTVLEQVKELQETVAQVADSQKTCQSDIGTLATHVYKMKTALKKRKKHMNSRQVGHHFNHNLGTLNEEEEDDMIDGLATVTNETAKSKIVDSIRARSLCAILGIFLQLFFAGCILSSGVIYHYGWNAVLSAILVTISLLLYVLIEYCFQGIYNKLECCCSHFFDKIDKHGAQVVTEGFVALFGGVVIAAKDLGSIDGVDKHDSAFILMYCYSCSILIYQIIHRVHVMLKLCQKKQEILTELEQEKRNLKLQCDETELTNMKIRNEIVANNQNSNNHNTNIVSSHPNTKIKFKYSNTN